MCATAAIATLPRIGQASDKGHTPHVANFFGQQFAGRIEQDGAQRIDWGITRRRVVAVALRHKVNCAPTARSQLHIEATSERNRQCPSLAEPKYNGENFTEPLTNSPATSSGPLVPVRPTRARYSILVIYVCACGHTFLHRVEIRAQSPIQAILAVPVLLSRSGGLDEQHLSSGSAVKEGT